MVARLSPPFTDSLTTQMSSSLSDPSDLVDMSESPAHSMNGRMSPILCGPGVTETPGQPSASEARSQPVLTDAQKSKLITSLEAEDFETAFQIIPKKDLSLLVFGPDNLSLLQYACQHGRDKLVRVLITNSDCLDPNTIITSMHAAAKYGQLEIVKVLEHEISSMQSLDGMQAPHCPGSSKAFTSDDSGNTPVHTAAAHGQLAVVEYLIDEAEYSPVLVNKEGHSPLHMASMYGHLPIVQYLTCVKSLSPSLRDEHGRTPLYLAVQSGRLDVVRYLASNIQCNSTSRHQKTNIDMCEDEDGNTALHLASQEGHLSMVKYLIDEQEIQPSCRNKFDVTPLHFASRNGRIEVVKFLSEEKGCDPLCRDKDRNAPLHYASHSGRLEVVNYFITEKDCDPMLRGQWGRTPLHYASQEGHLNVVKYLIDGLDVPPSCPDERNSTTPLHLASMNGHLNVIEFLISEKKCDPAVTDAFGKTPLDMVGESCEDETALYLLNKREGTDQDFAIVLPEYPSPVCPQIIVVGNSGSGKSTLVTALQDEKSALIGRFFKVKGTNLENAGITPTIFMSKKFGKVTFYDTAGREQYHACFESLLESTSHAIFVVTVDLQKTTDQIRRELKYWQLSIIKAASVARCRVHLISVGCYSDKLSTQDRKAKTALLSELVQLSLQSKGSVTLDSRKSSSKGMSILRQVLVQCCRAIRIEMTFDHIKSGCLESLISAKCLSDTTVCTFEELHTLVSANLNSEFQSLKCHPVLLQACVSLNTCGYLMFLENKENIKESWIIFDIKAMFSKVHSLIKHLKCFGIFTLSQLEHALLKQDKNLNTDLAIRFMLKVILCFEINMEAVEDHKATFKFPNGERCFFLPTLISEQPPSDMWNFDKECYLTGWGLTGREPWLFFSPRFLQHLLVSLTINFASVPQPPTSQAPLEPSPGCKLWQNGMRWLDDGIETIVEVVEQHTSVVMIMRCPKGNEMSCVKHRSSVIQHILHVYDRVCLEISPGPLEYLIHPHCLTTYPLPTISRIPMKQVAKSILNKECFIPLNEEVLSHVPGHHSLLLKELLFFEPYHYLGMELLKDIFNDQGDGYKSAVPESIIQKMSVCMAESWQNFAYTLQVFPAEVLSDCECRDNVRKCRKTLSLWAQASGSGTLESLRIDLSYYSIFARRDPLKLYPELISANGLVLAPDNSPAYSTDERTTTPTDLTATIIAEPDTSYFECVTSSTHADRSMRLQGHVKESTENKQPPSVENKQPPSVENKQPPSAENKQPPSAENKQPPSVENKQPPSVENKQPPSVENKQPPSAENKQPPSVENKQHPSVENKHPPSVENKPEEPTSPDKDIQHTNDIPLEDKITKGHNGTEDEVVTEDLQGRELPPTDIDPKQCRLESVAAVVTVGLDTRAILVTVDCNGVPVPVKDLSHIEAELKLCFNHSVSNIKDVIKLSGAKYAIKCKTSIRGEHEIHIKVDGVHIHNSPFPVFAQPHRLGRQLMQHNISEPVALACIGPNKEVRALKCTTQGLSLEAVWNSRGQRRPIHLKTGAQIQTVAPATGIAVDNHGCVYTVHKNQTVLKFSATRQLLKAIDFTNQSGSDKDVPNLSIKFGTDEKLYVCIPSVHKILVFDTDSELTFIKSLGTKGSGACEFQFPSDVGFDDSYMYVLDTSNRRVQVLDGAGIYCREFPLNKDPSECPRTPYRLHIDRRTNLLYATDPLHHRVLIYNTTSGECVATFGQKGSGPGQFSTPKGILVDANGYVFVCDYDNNRVTVF